MTEEFSRDILLRVVAQICQMIGFDTIVTSSLYTLVDVLSEFIRGLARTAQHYGEHCGRSEVTLSDLSLAFHDVGIHPSELYEFLQLVSPLPRNLAVPQYPVAIIKQYSRPESPVTEQVSDGNNTVGVRESLKLKISLSKIKELNKAKKSKRKKKKSKENKKRKKHCS